MSHRLFIAIELDREVQKNLSKICHQLQKEYQLNDRALKWVEPHNIHLTLKFLGEVDDPQIPELCDMLSDTTSQFEPFDFDIANCGCFPPQGSARVLWAGINEGTEDLQALAEAIDHGCHELGFALENRRFSPHLTLARIKQTKVGYQVRETLENFPEIQIASQPVDSIALIQSTLTRQGPEYTAMHHAKLAE